MTEKATNHSLKPRAQNQAWQNLVTISEALPQGLIFVGPAGVGKRRAVKALFQLLNCAENGDGAADGNLLFGAPPAEREPTKPTEPCGRCVSCRKIAEGRHADLIEIGPKGENIAVDDLREMKKTLFFSPIEGKFRFVIIDQAHKLNAASANALLKTLEEPPAHTRFFLITHERGLLLPTITSRCQFVHFSPLDETTLKELLVELRHEVPDRLLNMTLALLAGGLERAALLADEKTIAFIETVQRHLASPAKRWEETTALADQLASTAGSDDWRLELLLDLLVLGGHRGALASRNAAEARHFVARALDAVYLRRRLDRHANKKLVALAAAELTAAK
ncbi:MAG: DNA polymerase III subunit delta' [Deltaproteobacteria bacterium]|nr:DNA polymerase III subunit delta' [Deltaproteobacteria bacterium]